MAITSEALLNGSAPHTYVELRFSPSWELISDVRRFVTVFYQRILHQPELAARVALAAHELLENAAKYSRDGEAKLMLQVLHEGSTSRLLINVSNRADPEEVERLKGRFAQMREAPDAMTYYQQLIRNSRGRRERAGLGLARIQAEADLKLTCEVQGDFVSVIGTATLPEGTVPIT